MEVKKEFDKLMDEFPFLAYILKEYSKIFKNLNFPTHSYNIF